MHTSDAAVLPWCPALALAICLGMGIVVQASVGAPLGVWMAISSTALAFVVWLRLRSSGKLVDRSPVVAALLLCVATVSAGALRGAVYVAVPAGDVATIIDAAHTREVIVSGRVASYPQHVNGRSRFVLRVQEVRAAGETIARRGKMQMILRADEPVAVRRGERATVHGRAARLPIQRNPADFDYGSFLRRQGISGIIEATADEYHAVGGTQPIVHRWMDVLRLRIEHAIRQHTPSAEGRIMLRALLLGDRSGLSFEDRERLARSGLMHLLAVSGLHVLLVGMVLYHLLRPTLLRLRVSWRAAEWTRAGLTISILMAYMLITGGSPSVVRAVIMAALFIGGTLVQRPVHSLNTLGAAGLIILMIRPLDVFNAGFQLSFAAVGAILLFGPHMRRIDDSCRKLVLPIRYAAGSAAVSAAATLGTLPVLLVHFGRASFSGLILNVAAIPATFGVLASGLLLVVTDAASSAIASSFGMSADVLARVVMRLALEGERWSPVALVETRIRNLWWIAAIVAATALLTAWNAPRTRARLAIFTAACCVLGIWTSGVRTGVLDVIFFDVGQGDAALVRTPAGRTMLVDVGPRNLAFDAGERIVGPNLLYLGIKRIDAVVISHPHSDHLGGLPHILRAFDVRSVYHNGMSHESALFREVEHLLDSLAIPKVAVRAGDSIELDPALRIKILAPVSMDHTSINNGSIVLRLVHGDVSVLITGDAEASSEALLSRYFSPVLPSTLVKAGHHGSSTSSTPPFVDHVSAGDGGAVVISVAERNRYRHPSEDVLARWKSSGRRLHLTRDHGAVWHRSDGRSLTAVSWR